MISGAGIGTGAAGQINKITSPAEKISAKSPTNDAIGEGVGGRSREIYLDGGKITAQKGKNAAVVIGFSDRIVPMNLLISDDTLIYEEDGKTLSSDWLETNFTKKSVIIESKFYRMLKTGVQILAATTKQDESSKMRFVATVDNLDFKWNRGRMWR